jgi:tRNA nucleotidyltransferase (CCA-adding enzyme)
MNSEAGNESGVGAGNEMLQELAGLPGGRELLTLGAERPDLALVGGAVRDLLLGRTPRELDVVVEGDAGTVASDLVALVGELSSARASSVAHERFGTALVEWETNRIDVAGRRAESYPSPGALPQVRPGTSLQDLARRDFTVNAIAVALGGEHIGELSYPEHALEDLQERRLRVLHEGSFIDDPTRLLRLARYRARLGFTVEPRTAALAEQALAAGALETVSRARIGAELRLALAEGDAVSALVAMGQLGILEALEGRLELDEQLTRRALTLLPPDGRADLLMMASLLLPLSIDPREDPEPVMFELLDGLEFTAGDRERIMRTALVAPGLFDDLALATRPSEIHEALCAHTLEAIALGGAMGEGIHNVAAEAKLWFDRLRHVRLQITGQDLIDAGVPSGPQVGYRLSYVLACKLDDELGEGRDAELAAALEEGEEP